MRGHKQVVIVLDTWFFTSERFQSDSRVKGFFPILPHWKPYLSQQLLTRVLVILLAWEAKVLGIQLTQRNWLSIKPLSGTGTKIVSKTGKALPISEECPAYHKRKDVQKKKICKQSVNTLWPCREWGKNQWTCRGYRILHTTSWNPFNFTSSGWMGCIHIIKIKGQSYSKTIIFIIKMAHH